MVIHSVHVGVLLRSSLAGEGVSNRGVANGEKEDIEDSGPADRTGGCS